MRWPVLMLPVICATSTLAFADRIHLKHGDYVDVDTWREEGGMISCQRFGGTISISKDEVLRIEKQVTDPTMWQTTGSSRNLAAPTVGPEQESSLGQAKVTPPTVSGTLGPPPPLPPPPPATQGKAVLAAYWEGQKKEALWEMDDHANAKRSNGVPPNIGQRQG